MDTRTQIEHRLTEAFAPRFLEVADESHLHRGHPGAAAGGGHFRVRIAADALDGMRPIQRHRAVYAALGELMNGPIHALAISPPPSEVSAV